MARILALEETTLELRNALLRALRSTDEVVLLPQAQRSPESSSFKNAIFTLEGSAGEAPASVFSSEWSSGISAVLLDDRDVEPLLRDPDLRQRKLAELANKIPSEVADSSLVVGPDLDGDDADRDIRADWVAGFDSSTCLVGLFCAEHSRAPEVGTQGQNRIHRASYLVCRAGAGVAAATFHSRLVGAMKKGRSLDEALLGGKEPGPQALRRVSAAGSRNRARILLKAAEILGFNFVSSIGDQASGSRLRGAVPTIDVNTNTLRVVEDNGASHWVYSTGIDCGSNQGVITSSNVSDGFIVFLSPTGGKLLVRNDAMSSVPFGSARVVTNRDMASRVLEKMKKGSQHVDEEFVKDRFSWKNRDFGPRSQEVIPFCLHGTHLEETFSSSFGRELGLSRASVVRLRPELVCLAGVDAGKLRPLVKSL